MKSITVLGASLALALSGIPVALAGGPVEFTDNRKVDQTAIKNATPSNAYNGGCLTTIDTQYTGSNDPPSNVIKELSGCSVDINKGFGGDYVWLVPQYDKYCIADSPDNIWFAFVAQAGDQHTSDLARGAGGIYRYLNCFYFGFYQKVKEVQLWRTDYYTTTPTRGWVGMTTDIKQDRGGDYLYLIWRV